jgi:hypothetical protein
MSRRLSVLILSLLAVGCGGPPPGLEKHLVSGVVTVNGNPAERMAVTFHHPDESLLANLRYPTGVTDAEGRFTLSSESENDGAVRGKYRVTFSWLSSPELDAIDMFSGGLGNPARSEYAVDVPLSSQGLVFPLTFPESKLKRPRSAKPQ